MLRGLDQVERNLDIWYKDGIMRRCREAMEEICVLLEGHAKTDHGDQPRDAGYVYPGGGVKRFREAGTGWGDVTGQTTQSTRAFITNVSPRFIDAVLTSNTPQAVFLELARDGKWAWLWPAIESKLPEIKAILKRIVE